MSTADPTQPEGALPEPAFHLIWRRGSYYVSKPNIDEADCYTADQMRAMMAERDAARAERDALRRELETRKPQWISVEDRIPFTDDDDVPVYTWDGKTVAEDTFGPEWDQPAGPAVGGFLRVGDNFGDIHRNVTHWMPRILPAPPAGTSVEDEA